MFFPDLSTSCQIAEGPRVRAIGWLSSKHDFSRGPLDDRVITAIQRLVEEGWVHVAMPGPHTCELCENHRNASNVLIPSVDVLYVAPAMIVHYMQGHGYAPPSAFCAAVLACPAPDTDAYFAELRRFVDVFSARMTAAQFDELARQHRAWKAEVRTRRAAEATRKRFTWD